ncbi:MAG TPA: HIT domain-containing protein [Spirochaetota bacterium]|nr:MAG: AP-4-A phosphorylase [Spirochaetes bacterium ADurb.Bin218]HOK02324.1 HIT domain-containing protein [Spirochaetota bacterium]HOK92538.1 HIT domain-containing protein [Spirochaetota bacterium]HON15284.1 HIT domain-containing protein [Spirochaetota bacterium]HOQ12548.1 HIT domain-containing protein [Spirochaetota bacterium]
MERNYLFNTEKIKYVKGEKPSVPCILCAIIEDDPAVKNLTVYKDDLVCAALNLFPFNPGHLMIFPLRHITSIAELTAQEVSHMHNVLVRAVNILDNEFAPSGYNVGYNLGKGSGASIDHIHQHIVPRYENEVGFLDVLAGARVIVSDPVAVMEKLKKRFEE